MCSKKPKRVRRYDPNKRDEADFFRSTSAWQKKREEIKERDGYLCQVCLRGLYGTKKRITYEDTEVHHIAKLSETLERCLDNEWLITLCRKHHDMADRGEIPPEELHQVAVSQEKRKS